MGSQQSVEKSSDALKMGVLGCARINETALFEPANKLPNVILYGIASRNSIKAAEYAKKHGFIKSYGSYEDLLADPAIEAVYIPLPNGLHYEWTMKALAAGKHVLCEKPLCNNAMEAQKMCDEAQKRKLVLVEAFHWMYHPLAKRIKQIVNNGELGTITKVYSDHLLPMYAQLYKSEARPDDIRFKYDLGGGILMDVGSYTISAVRFVMGKEPVKINWAHAELMSPEVDKAMEAEMEFDKGEIGHIKVDFRSLRPITSSAIKVFGLKGTLSVDNFMRPHDSHTLVVKLNDGHTRTEKCYGDGHSTFYYQLQNFVKEVRSGEPCNVTADHGVKNMTVIDAIYEKAGLKKRGLNKKLESEGIILE